jgi:hypothetical protein
MYSSTLSLTSALYGLVGQLHAPVALPPEKTRYPLCRRLGVPQGRSGWVEKTSSPPGFDPRTFQPVASTEGNGKVTMIWGSDGVTRVAYFTANFHNFHGEPEDKHEHFMIIVVH